MKANCSVCSVRLLKRCPPPTVFEEKHLNFQAVVMSDFQTDCRGYPILRPDQCSKLWRVAAFSIGCLFLPALGSGSLKAEVLMDLDFCK